jgi:hypothetical protein
MPNKHNAKRRHHIPKMKFKVRNWKEYEAGLRQRGSLTMWITDEAMAGWKAAPRLSPGGQAIYSNLAIEAALMVRLAFRLPLRQTEGLMTSVLQLLNLGLPVPDHSTVSRRALNLKTLSTAHDLPSGPLDLVIDSTGLKLYGAGEWLQDKHGAKSKRIWKKLHLAVDVKSGQIVAWTLTDKDTSDVSQVKPLLDQVKAPLACFLADGAYDGEPTYQRIEVKAGKIPILIPPPITAVLEGVPRSQRDQHILGIQSLGRLGWQKATGYGRRSLVETTMGRYKGILGPKLRARSSSGQETEVRLGVAVLNRMLQAGKPDSIRKPRLAA